MPEGFNDLVRERMAEAETDVLPLGTGDVFAVQSKSDPMVIYYVTKLPWITLCPCKGFRFRSDCKHVREVDGDGVDNADVKV